MKDDFQERRVPIQRRGAGTTGAEDVKILSALLVIVGGIIWGCYEMQKPDSQTILKSADINNDPDNVVHPLLSGMDPEDVAFIGDHVSKVRLSGGLDDAELELEEGRGDKYIVTMNDGMSVSLQLSVLHAAIDVLQELHENGKEISGSKQYDFAEIDDMAQMQLVPH